MNDKIKEKLKLLPELPGSYQMLDKDGNIIYVGKAKNLKNRVRSYFVGAHNSKTTALVSKIDDLRYIITSNETEAFLLEISLIKEYNPFYNIDLTDDKTYPYIEFTKEANPKLIITRNLSKKNTRYFGPYTNVKSARNTLDLLNRIYKLRKCNHVGKEKCIYYDMHECIAPCINKIDKETYDEIYSNIKSLLYGNDLTILNNLKKDMATYSQNLDFENAIKTRDLINDIENTLVRQDVILKDTLDTDIYGVTYDENFVCISLIYVRGGKIVLSKNDCIPYYFDPLDSIILSITNNYKNVLCPKFIFIDEEYKEILSHLLPSTSIITPLKGTKHNLLLMAKENSINELNNKNKAQLDKRRDALIELSDLLSINIPKRIESFDNSNLFGDSPVSACITYIDGKKAPKEYRKYIIKDVVGPNDYDSMKEVTYRRYKRLLDESLPLPDLILMDGGKIQIDACLEVLNSLNININVAGMKKDKTHTTDTLIFNDKEFELDRHSSLYKLLSEIQEEVHRFAITYHRSRKENNDFISVLDTIKGIGPITKEKLMKNFKTIKDIKNSNIDSLKDLGLTQNQIDSLMKKLEEEIEVE